MEILLTAEQLESIRRLDTCTVSNVIETFDVRLRNEGFANGTIRCFSAGAPSMLGYAATARVRSSGPPPVGHTYFDRTDWWNHILEAPAPRVVVLEDVDPLPGFGAIVGEVHVNIFTALGCSGIVTNGAIRDLPALVASGLHLFAGNLSVSHAYMHIVEFGGTVEIGGLAINPGDLIHGDIHGIQTIPPGIAADIPARATEILEKERIVIDLCRSPDFRIEKLRQAIKELE